jgi:hypothetical protein
LEDARNDLARTLAFTPKEPAMGKNKKGTIGLSDWWLSVMLSSNPPGHDLHHQRYNEATGEMEWQPKTEAWIQSKEFLLLMTSLNRRMNGW